MDLFASLVYILPIRLLSHDRTELEVVAYLKVSRCWKDVTSTYLQHSIIYYIQLLVAPNFCFF
jgi:hypothetical protein